MTAAAAAAAAAAAVEKLLPQSVEAEAGVLGSILIDPAALSDVTPLVTPEDFYREAHRTIYAAMVDMMALRVPVDLITLTDELARRGELEDIGGVSCVSSLANQVPTSANADHYARIVAEKATLRRLIQAAGQIAAIAYNEPDVEEASETARIILETALLRQSGKDSRDIGDVFDDFLRAIEDTKQNGTQPGVTLGLGRLDEHLFGVLPGELVYLAGRPGSGKSAVAAVMATHAALSYGHVEWVSLEMSNIQQAKRIITSSGTVNGRIIRAGFVRPDGAFDEDAYEQVHEMTRSARNALAGRLRLYDKPLTIAHLCQHAKRAVYKRGCKLLIVDYLGLLEGDNPKETDYQRISKISRQLKQLALELNIPILCLVQMSRESERRQNKRPQLSDLRDSGGLEQDADVVLGMYRGAYYDPERATTDAYFREYAELIVLKVREGVANVSIPLRFEGEFTRPSDWPDDWPIPTETGNTGNGNGGAL